MKIIVTGSEGLLGKEIVKHLEKNYDVIKLDLISGEVKKEFKFLIININLNFFAKRRNFVWNASSECACARV